MKGSPVAHPKTPPKTVPLETVHLGITDLITYLKIERKKLFTLPRNVGGGLAGAVSGLGAGAGLGGSATVGSWAGTLSFFVLTLFALCGGDHCDSAICQANACTGAARTLFRRQQSADRVSSG